MVSRLAKTKRSLEIQIPIASGEVNSSSKMRPSEAGLGQTASEKAFTNNVVLERIINFVIHDTDGNINRKNVCNVRLVQKGWLDTTSKLLRNSMEPVINLNLSSGNSLNQTDFVKKNGKRLDQFVTRFTAAAALPESSLPFKLHLAVDYFHEENYESLLNCLSRVGKELKEFQVVYPSDGGTLPVSFQQLNLPLLRKLALQFSTIPLPRHQQDDNAPRFGNNNNGLWLLQSILNGSNNVKVFTVTASGKNVVPMGFEYLRLPDSLLSLELRLPIKTKHLDLFMKNRLTNLSFLSPLHHNKEDKLFHTLKAFGGTLTSFTMKSPCISRSCSRVLLRFPVMKNLETINRFGTNCVLETSALSALEKCFPKLKNLCLMEHSEAMLLKWIQNSKFEHVQSLGLSVINEKIEKGNCNYFSSLSFDLMAQVHTAFPNIRHLNLYLNVSNLNCLKYVMESMQLITELQIKFRGKIEVDPVDQLDSVLLGIPGRMVTVLKEDCQFLETFTLKRGNQASIMNLTSLNKLVLGTEDINRPEDGGKSLLSDLLVSQGLMKMPELRYLGLSGRFQPSPKMQTQWKEQGRRILKYSSK